MSSDDYIKNAIKNMEDELGKSGDRLPAKSAKTSRPYPVSYRPEMDISKELDDDKANRFQKLIGVLR